jgi:threonine aldolase
LIDIDGIEIDLKSVQTNMVYLQTKTPAVEIVKKLADHGIDVLAIGSNLIRMVIHLHINDQGIQKTIHAFQKISDSLG